MVITKEEMSAVTDYMDSRFRGCNWTLETNDHESRVQHYDRLVGSRIGSTPSLYIVGEKTRAAYVQTMFGYEKIGGGLDGLVFAYTQNTDRPAQKRSVEGSSLTH